MLDRATVKLLLLLLLCPQTPPAIANNAHTTQTLPSTPPAHIPTLTRAHQSSHCGLKGIGSFTMHTCGVNCIARTEGFICRCFRVNLRPAHLESTQYSSTLSWRAISPKGANHIVCIPLRSSHACLKALVGCRFAGTCAAGLGARHHLTASQGSRLYQCARRR